MTQLNELEKQVVHWAKEKGIFEKSTPRHQLGKTEEELAEVIEEVENNGRKQDIEMELGDVLVTLSIQAAMQGTTLGTCLEKALNKITKRKGEMRDGVFVKEGS